VLRISQKTAAFLGAFSITASFQQRRRPLYGPRAGNLLFGQTTTEYTGACRCFMCTAQNWRRRSKGKIGWRIQKDGSPKASQTAGFFRDLGPQKKKKLGSGDQKEVYLTSGRGTSAANFLVVSLDIKTGDKPVGQIALRGSGSQGKTVGGNPYRARILAPVRNIQQKKLIIRGCPHK